MQEIPRHQEDAIGNQLYPPGTTPMFDQLLSAADDAGPDHPMEDAEHDDDDDDDDQS